MTGKVMILMVGRGVGLPTVLLVMACSRDPGSRERMQPNVSDVVPVAAAQSLGAGQSSPPASDRFDEAAFSLRIQPKGRYEAGKEGAVEVLIDAKDPYHVNDEYPTKLKLEVLPGIRFPAPVVGKEGVEISGKHGRLTVRLTPEAAGEHRIAGRLSFSVCNDERCLVERRDLAVKIRVP
ncbi:MAG: hypothetical protein JW751_09150 [Polyangiaceae bacterium]|nr:hypothetical protein [Polyangiaceae bacterium]